MLRKTYREQQSVNDYVSIFGGLLIFAFGFTRRTNPVLSALAVTIGASKIAEGISGYSPVPDLWQTVSGTAAQWQEKRQAEDQVAEKRDTDESLDDNNQSPEFRLGRHAVTRRL